MCKDCFYLIMLHHIGGKQAKLRDTVWQGHPQHLTFPDGRPKGMKLILEERGIDTVRWTAKEMRAELASHEDFRDEKTVVEKAVEEGVTSAFSYPSSIVNLTPLKEYGAMTRNM